MKNAVVLTSCLLASTLTLAAEMSVTLNQVSEAGVGAAVGTVRIVETQHGLAFYPQLTGLAPGLHGFHVHEKPSCAASESDGKKVPGGAAGGHLDPAGSKKHGEPWGDGHLGDLPALVVAADGSASNPVLAPRLKS
ncbi:MAG TPA: superoxide dismutase family protein, partial [Rubrivivax sp.]|nr:superoxide dismutase family protein [Rubrivivax sp.]